MFRAQAMSRVELAIPEQVVIPVTEVLAASGVFHLALSEHPGPENIPDQAGQWREWVNAFTALERRILDVMEALYVDEGPPPAETPRLILPDVAALDVDHLERETQTCVQDLEEQKQRLAQLQRYVSQLEPVAELNADLDTIRNLRYLFAMMGTIPVANLERLRSSLEHVSFKLVTLRRDEYLATVVLFGARRDAEVLTRAARSAYLNPLNLPETYRGTPAEAIEALRAGIKRTQERIDEFQAKIDRLHEAHVDHLRLLLWRVRASRTLAQTVAQYGRLRYTYLVEGWTPAAKIPLLQEKIRQVSNEVVVEVAPPPSRQEAAVPAALDSPGFLRAFQGLVTNYGCPRYGEVNPTLVLALTFPLVFGIMFGDVGHGLVMALVGVLLVSRAVRALRDLAAMGTILIACGVAATAFGFLYDSFFGIENVFGWHWVQPLEETESVLQAVILIGAGLLSLGMVLNGVNALLTRRWGHALFGHNGLAGLVFYWSLIGLAAGVLGSDLPIPSAHLAVVAGISGLAVAFGEVLGRLVEGHRPLVEEGVGTYLMQAFFGVFEMLIGLLSNTLSYVRMGAFAVAHGALSFVVFKMAEALSPVGSAPYWIIVALGNLFVIGFEGMIVSIQTLRLEYYEFFNRFFSGDGVRYRPLTLVWQGETRPSE